MVVDAKGGLRLLSVAESGCLHFLREDHTLGGLRSSEAKHSPKLEVATRVSMIDDGFNHLVVAWLFGHLGPNSGFVHRPPTLRELPERAMPPVFVTRGAGWPACQCSMS